MQGERQLDNPEIRPEVAAVLTDRRDDEFPYLRRQLAELRIGKTAKILRCGHGIEKHFRPR